MRMITCVYPDGVKTHLRHVSVGSILLNKSHDQVLLVKRSPQSFVAPNTWDIPGGNMDINETTQQTALREIQEETGHSAVILNLLCINETPNEREERHNVEFIYIAEIGEKITVSDNETTGYKWFDLHSLPYEDSVAFNRFKDLEFYIRYTQEKFILPVIK